MVFLVIGRDAENIEKKNKTDRRKTLEKNQRIQGKSNKNNKHLWFYLNLSKKYIFYLKNIVVKGKKLKSSLYHHILLTVFKCCRIFETQ